MNQNTYMEDSNRANGLFALAIVGFVALVCLGIWLAVYSARYVPGTVSRIGSAAVALSSVFTPGPSGLAVIPSDSASTTIPFGDGSATTTTTTTTSSTGTGSVATQPGNQTSGTYPLGGGTAPAAYSGLPDLTVSITSVGYLTTNTADSFVAAAVVPHGYRPAVKFTVTNIGTNVAGQWRFSAVIPTQTAYVYQSQSQQSLNPGDSIDYTLGFDQALTGSSQTVTLKVNYDNGIAESNTGNDGTSATLNVQ